jgi:hypothetical protein
MLPPPTRAAFIYKAYLLLVSDHVVCDYGIIVPGVGATGGVSWGLPAIPPNRQPVQEAYAPQNAPDVDECTALCDNCKVLFHT